MDLVNQTGDLKRKENPDYKGLSLRSLYLGFAILGAIAAWGSLLQFLFSGNASIDAFLQQSFATAISSLWTTDVLISAFVFFIFSRVELKRLGVPLSWWVIYAFATVVVGPCFSLSLFLYQRETWRLQTHLSQT